MKEKAISKIKKTKMLTPDQGSVYRTTPYQFIFTAPLENNTQMAGNSLIIKDQITTIKPVTISTKIK
jgi:hypothetical protein